ncbi:cytochrome P450 [Rhodococcus oryzae]|uniref:Cytochrome P450 n=1 Tax=Rhodococcus oryzae TaxID=2571143 RepID=A0ABY2RF05_9NOCA|nr:cytochrome P450 [Rhodococcus oryzae]TJZ74980.1 cytochrome P450 [Rhodococcus oryzae]
MRTPNIPDGFDLTDPAVYEARLPAEEFADLRRTAPVWWSPQSPDKGGFGDGGYWAVTKHADVKEVSRNGAVFSTWQNSAIPRFADDTPRETIDMLRNLLLNKDAPEHTKLRKLISRAFTPRSIADLRPALQARAESIVKQAAAGGTGDFVTQVAAELPLQAIAELIGVPQDDRGKIFDWSNQMMGYDDPEFAAASVTATTELLGYSYLMAEQRKQCPAGDLLTTLVEADVDGEALTSEEFGFFVLILAVAGNETTRNAITHGIMAFLDHPDQWELYKRERPATAVDEIIRWATPVTAFQRTALSDTQLGCQEIAAGDRVVMFYASANFDEDVFENPMEFDITRAENPHLSFGGTGAHYCVGANLARMEVGLMFDAIADHMPDLSRIGDPRRLRSGWINGIKELQVDYRGGCPVQHG